MGNVDCVFCKIVTGELPTGKLYEDEDLVVVPDKNPSAPVHLLFISKTHGEEFHKTDPAKLERMLNKVREKILELNVPYRVAMNGAGANMVPDHFHIHLLGKVSADKPI